MTFLLLFCTYPWLRPLLCFVNYSCWWKGNDMWKISGFIHATVYCIWVRRWCMWMFGLLTWHWPWRNYCMLCPWLVHDFFACGLACKVGWLEENDCRAALTRWYHVSSVTATCWCELCCFVWMYVFLMLSQVNKIVEQTKKKCFLDEASLDLRRFRWTAASMYGSTPCYSVFFAGFHLCTSVIQL